MVAVRNTISHADEFVLRVSIRPKRNAGCVAHALCEVAHGVELTDANRQSVTHKLGGDANEAKPLVVVDFHEKCVSSSADPYDDPNHVQVPIAVANENAGDDFSRRHDLQHSALADGFEHEADADPWRVPQCLIVDITNDKCDATDAVEERLESAPSRVPQYQRLLLSAPALHEPHSIAIAVPIHV